MAKSKSKLRDTFSLLRSILVLDWLIWLYTIVLGALSLISSLWDRDGNTQHGFARLWSRMILATAMSPVRVQGLERLPEGAAIYAVTHGSALDIPVLYAHLPRQFRIMAKRELFRYPFMGWHLRRSGQIPVDTDGPGSPMSVRRAIRTLQAGMPLLVFPEGGRSADGCIQPFLAGAFRRRSSRRR